MQKSSLRYELREVLIGDNLCDDSPLSDNFGNLEGIRRRNPQDKSKRIKDITEEGLERLLKI